MLCNRRTASRMRRLHSCTHSGRSARPPEHQGTREGQRVLGLMALATATVWIVLFMFVRPARGETVDARMFYVIDGDTLARGGGTYPFGRGRPSGDTRGSMRARARRRLRDEGPRCRPSALRPFRRHPPARPRPVRANARPHCHRRQGSRSAVFRLRSAPKHAAGASKQLHPSAENSRATSSMPRDS